ncbi:MAG: phytanoyl-CoA dioxygenase family protein [Acidimicrobiales bacterium]
MVEPHPWSEGFTWRSPTPPFTSLDAEQVEQFDRLGYVVVDPLIPAALVAAAGEEIDGFEARTEAWLARRPDGRESIAEVGAITFSVHLAARSALLGSLSVHPAIAGICADLLGPDVDLYWDQAVYKKPEKPRRFPWHQDNGYTFVEPQQYLTVWLALTDATEANGCPIVAPGSHRGGTLRHRWVEPLGWECFDGPEGVVEVAAPVRAGGAVVFSSFTPHKTGPAITVGWRG